MMDILLGSSENRCSVLKDIEDTINGPFQWSSGSSLSTALELTMP
jgi:hypothetical protein